MGLKRAGRRISEAGRSALRKWPSWSTDLYADDLVIIADSLEECVRRLLIWKEAMEKKGLRVNAGKTKVMICGTGLDLLQSSGEYPCAVCRTGVGNNSIDLLQCVQTLGALEMQWATTTDTKS